jgi:hypothetical protein
LRTVGDIIAVSGDPVKTDGLDELARANVLRSDCAIKVSTFVSNGGSLGVRSWLRCDVRTTTRDVCFTSTAGVSFSHDTTEAPAESASTRMH